MKFTVRSLTFCAANGALDVGLLCPPRPHFCHEKNPPMPRTMTRSTSTMSRDRRGRAGFVGGGLVGVTGSAEANFGSTDTPGAVDSKAELAAADVAATGLASGVPKWRLRQKT